MMETYCSRCGHQIENGEAYTVDLDGILCTECSMEDLKYLLEEKWADVWEDVASVLNIRLLEVWNG